jgi:hypothetical protein
MHFYVQWFGRANSELVGTPSWRAVTIPPGIPVDLGVVEPDQSDQPCQLAKENPGLCGDDAGQPPGARDPGANNVQVGSL